MGRIGTVQTDLATELTPVGFNIGANVGTSAGRTIAHAHLHVIPRFDNNVPTPEAESDGCSPTGPHTGFASRHLAPRMRDGWAGCPRRVHVRVSRV